MTITTLSIVCILLAALCLCLWVYASMANEDLIEATWEADYYERRYLKYRDMYLALYTKGRTP